MHEALKKKRRESSVMIVPAVDLLADEQKILQSNKSKTHLKALDWKQSKMYTEYVVNQANSKDELESDQLRIRSDEINFVKQ